MRALKQVTSCLFLLVLVLSTPAWSQIGPGPGGGGPPIAPLPALVVPAGNPITAQKAVLGKILFWDEQMSSDNRMACGTCHRPGVGGVDPRVGVNPGADGSFGTADDVFGSPGVRRADVNNNFVIDPAFALFPQVTGRTTPTMINAAFAPVLFWDGRATNDFVDPQTGVTVLPSGAALESQAVGPPLSGAEMAHDMRNWPEIVAKLALVTPLKLASNVPADMAAALTLNPDYPSLFQAAFGSNQITAAKIAMAIATYQRTLISDQTPFDQFLAGNTNAMTLSQRQGMMTYLTTGNCSICHSGALTTDHGFRNIGVRPPAEDPGRMNVTGNPSDLGKFKTPTLRNIGLKSQFMHNGQFTDLFQVLAFYDRGGDFVTNIDPLMAVTSVPLASQAALVDFLANALTDPRVAQATFPFDRPTLHSEVQPLGSPTFGPALPGLGGFSPVMLAFDPSNVGNIDYRLGVTNARGGTQAYLLYSDVPAAPGTQFGGVPIAVDVNDPSFGYVTTATGGVGAGDGVATLHFPIPNLPSLAGFVRYVQWWVYDPSSPAAWTFSASQGAQISVF